MKQYYQKQQPIYNFNTRSCVSVAVVENGPFVSRFLPHGVWAGHVLLLDLYGGARKDSNNQVIERNPTTLISSI